MIKGLIFLCAIELGWIPYGAEITYNPIEYRSTKNDLYTSLESGLSYYGFFGIGKINTFIQRKDGQFKFNPNTIFFAIEIGYETKYIKIAYEHMCYHPVPTYFEMLPGEFIREGSVDRIYIRFENNK